MCFINGMQSSLEMDEIALKKRNRNSSREQILHLSKATKRIKLACVEDRKNAVSRRGLADVSNTFSGTQSSLDGSCQETPKDSKISIQKNDEDFNLESPTSEAHLGHLPSRKQVKSPRCGPKRYINTTRVLEPLRKRKLPGSPELLPVDLSSGESGDSDDESHGSSFSTDYGDCVQCSQESKCSYDLREYRSIDSDDLGSQPPYEPSKLVQEDILVETDDGSRAEYSSIELARRDPIEFDDCLDRPWVQELTKGILDQSDCEDKELLKNYSLDDEEAQAVGPYFNSTLLDKTGARPIQDIPDIYDFSAIQESFEPIALDFSNGQLKDSLELYRNKGITFCQTADAFQDDSWDDIAARHQQEMENTPLGKNGPCATSSPRRPMKCVRFSHKKQGKLQPKNATFLLSEKGEDNNDGINCCSVPADCEVGQAAACFQPPPPACRVLVQEPSCVPDELKSKYPPGILKPTRFKIIRSTSTPLHPRKNQSYDSLDIDMSEVQLSTSELELPGHRSLGTVNSEEIHVTDPLLELEMETVHTPKLSYVQLEEEHISTSHVQTNEIEPAKKTRKICSLF